MAILKLVILNTTAFLSIAGDQLAPPPSYEAATAYKQPSAPPIE